MCPSKVEPDSSLGPLPLECPLPPLRLLPGRPLASPASSQLLLLVELSLCLTWPLSCGTRDHCMVLSLYLPLHYLPAHPFLFPRQLPYASVCASFCLRPSTYI